MAGLVLFFVGGSPLEGTMSFGDFMKLLNCTILTANCSVLSVCVVNIFFGCCTYQLPALFTAVIYSYHIFK